MLASRFMSAPLVACRTMSTTASVDWSFLRSKMISDAGRANIDRARDSFNARLNAAAAVGAPSEIDWAVYKAKLPDANIDALKADYEAFMASIPELEYDPTADAAEHAEQEAKWTEFAKFCAARVDELLEVKAEQDSHKLHSQYSASRAFQRFDGLFEKEWAKVMDCDFFTNLDSPDTSEELTDAAKDELRQEAAQATGLPTSSFGGRASQ